MEVLVGMKSMISIISRQLKIVTILFVTLSIVLVGYKNNDFLTKHEWVHYDSACDEIISFGTDGHFAYYTTDGSPVGDFDLYDQYSYDSKHKKIKLKPSENMSIKVLRYEKSRLLLDINGDVKEFLDEKDKFITGSAPQNLAYDTDNTVTGFSSYLAILSKDASEIITAPANYDGDDLEFKEYEFSETLADHVEFYMWTYDVDQSQEPTITESTYNKLTEKEATNIIKNGGAVGFVWYDAQAKITKIVFFGRTICQ